VSTPTSLELPDGVRRTTIRTARGAFAALEAVPGSGVCERDAALLVPGYTGSKEDFLAILDLLADDSRHVIAIDMRGQFETAAADDLAGYAAAALGADILAIMQATGARHLVGHSYGGLIGREAVLAGTGADPAGTGADPAGTGAEFASFTLMSSGPGALTGARAQDLRAMLATVGVGVGDGGWADGRKAAGRTRSRSGPGSPSSGRLTWSRRPSRPESPGTSSRSSAAGCGATIRLGWS
jgi:pimeloyl-ACP methyl ester carboxylesterase